VVDGDPTPVREAVGQRHVGAFVDEARVAPDERCGLAVVVGQVTARCVREQHQRVELRQSGGAPQPHQIAVLDVAQAGQASVLVREPGPGRRGGIDAHPDRQGVDEQADHPFHPRELRGSAGHRHAEQHVISTGRLGQHQSPRALHQGGDRDAPVARRGRHPAREVGGERRAHRGGLAPRDPPFQRERGGPRPGQLGGPEGVLPLGVARLEPVDEVPERAGCRQRLPAVGAAHVVEHPAHRPPVEQEVVVRPGEVVVAVAEVGEAQAQERGAVEGELAEVVGHAVRRVARVSGHDDLDVVEDRLERPICFLPEERGPEDGVELDDGPPRRLEAIDIEVAEPRRELLHVDRRVADRVEQHPALHGRQRVDVLHLGGCGHGRPRRRSTSRSSSAAVRSTAGKSPGT